MNEQKEGSDSALFCNGEYLLETEVASVAGFCKKISSRPEQVTEYMYVKQKTKTRLKNYITLVANP